MMKISNRFLLILTVILLLTISVSGCNFPNYVDESEFVDKTYIYEKDGDQSASKAVEGSDRPTGLNFRTDEGVERQSAY